VSVIAASKPNSGAVLSNPLQLIVFVCAFMTLKLSIRAGGSNDNYHHISAKYIRRIDRHWLTAHGM
jgi:hypothetical protein